MSIPDVVLLSVRAAGVDPADPPLTWDIRKHDDGSISSHMRWMPSAVNDGEGSAGIRQKSVTDLVLQSIRVAGVDPADLPITWDVCRHADGSISTLMRWIPSAVKNDCRHPASSAGLRQKRTIPATSPSTGKRQCSMTVTAPSTGKRQRSAVRPPVNNDSPVTNLSTGKRQFHSKVKTPCRLRRDSKRRAAWRKTLLVPDESPTVVANGSDSSSPVTVDSQPQPSERENETVDSQPRPVHDESSLPVSSAAVVIQQSSDTSPAADVTQQFSDTSPAADVTQQSSELLISPLPRVKREKAEYMKSDTLPGVFFRAIVESDSDDDLPLSDPAHPGHLAYLWSKANCIE